MRFLFIDNEKRWANYIKSLLESKGYEIEIEIDYSKAFEHAKQNNFDLIFLDSKAFFQNPKFIYQLTTNGYNNRVIITSSSPNYGDAMNALRYGAVDYISKQYDCIELLKIINKNINSHPVSKEYLKRRLEE